MKILPIPGRGTKTRSGLVKGVGHKRCRCGGLPPPLAARAVPLPVSREDFYAFAGASVVRVTAAASTAALLNHKGCVLAVSQSWYQSR